MVPLGVVARRVKDSCHEARKATSYGLVVEPGQVNALVSQRRKGKQTIPGVPTKWDSNRFDVVLRFDRAMPNAPWSFRQLSPRLMSGDSDAPFTQLEG